MENLFQVLSKRTTAAGRLIQHLQTACSEIESQKQNLNLATESVADRLIEIEILRESLQKREKDLDSSSRFSSKDENHENLEFKHEKLNKKLLLVQDHIKWLEAAQSEVEAVKRRACNKLTALEEEEKLFSNRKRKIDLVVDTLDERIRVVEDRESEFDLLVEGRTREFVLKENELRVKEEEIERFRNEREALETRLSLAEGKLEEVRLSIEKFKGIEVWENVARGSIEKLLNEFEGKKEEFRLFKERKMREFVSREEGIRLMSEELVKEVELNEGRLGEGERKGRELLKRLEFARGNVEELRVRVREKVKEIGLKEIEVGSLRDWVEAKMEEVDCKVREFEEREKGIKIKEDKVVYKKKELKKRRRRLNLKEKNLRLWLMELKVLQKEVDAAEELNVKRAGELDWREKQQNSVKEFTQKCFHEHRAIKKQLKVDRDLVEKRARELEHKEQQLEDRARGLEYKEKQIGDYVKELELRKGGLSNAINVYGKIEPDDSSDLKFVVTMDGKTLQMFLNDTEKDLETMDGEIFKVLRLSSDPAKLVLDAMEGFYPPHLRKGDLEFNVRRTCIVLLQQLTKMSVKIKPCVREEAVKIASEWKSKMRTNGENALEVLGFLHLMAAYNLVSSFDKDEILVFVKIVAQNSRTPELRRVLGFVEAISGSHFEDVHWSV